MYYKFGKPRKEGKNPDGTPFYTVELLEYGRLGVLRSTRVSLKDAKYLLSKALSEPYKEDDDNG